MKIQRIKIENLKEENIFEVNQDEKLIFLGKNVKNIKSEVIIIPKYNDLNIDVILRIIPNKNSQIKLNFIAKADTNISNSQIAMDLRALIIKENVDIEIKPILYIKGNTHEIQHKVAIGGFNSKDIQYLAMRGISKKYRNKLLSEAFVNV